jgi:glutathione S-transferase
VKLYNADLSPNALRARAVAFELGFEPELVPVDLRKGENRSDWFLRLNPNGKVPVLVDGDFVLWESRAIAGYLAGLRPERGLLPVEPRRRAAVDQWSYWQAIHLGPPMQGLGFERVWRPHFGLGEPNEEAIAGHLKEIARLLPILDAGLAGGEWVAGELSIADFAVASTFMLRAKAGIPLDAVPNVAAWIARLEARPSWQRAVAPYMAGVP